MGVILKEKLHVAKKEYDCDACAVLINYLHEIDFIDEEIEVITKANSNNWKIKPGEKYIYQVGIFCGDFYTVKCIPEITNICHKYELYDTE